MQIATKYQPFKSTIKNTVAQISIRSSLHTVCYCYRLLVLRNLCTVLETILKCVN